MYISNVSVIVKMLTRHSNFFPDPFDCRKGSLVIEFYGYRKQNTVPSNDMNGCYFQAEAIALDKITHGQGEIPMGLDSQWWSLGSVYLWIEPREQMIWRDWFDLLLPIRLFVSNNRFKGTQFIILKDGLGPIGTGYVLALPEEKSVATDATATA